MKKILASLFCLSLLVPLGAQPSRDKSAIPKEAPGPTATDTAADISADSASASETTGTAAAPTTTPEPAAAASPTAAPKTVAAAIPPFASVSDGGIILAAAESWYLEEFDAKERPIAGTLWIKGEIVKRTTWVYAGSAQQADKKIITGLTGSTETGFDAHGNEILVIQTGAKGIILSTLTKQYNSINQLTESELTTGTKIVKTELEYTAGDRLKEKRVYTNGQKTIIYAYASEDNWTETIYSNEVPVLVVTYENGARKKDTNEKKH